MSQPAPIRVGTWNVQAIRGLSFGRAARIRDVLIRYAPDVLMLQEVSTTDVVTARIRGVLENVGLIYQHYSGQPRAETKRYGNIIASRWMLEPIDWPIETRWPQLTAATGVTVPGGALTAVTTHIPNGSGNGWDKIYAFEALADGLRGITGPLVLGGDFNEPRSVPPVWLSFGATRQGQFEGTHADLFGRIDTRQRWQDAVATVLDDSNPEGVTAWGGRHVETSTGMRFEATHMVQRHCERYFDHIVTRGMQRVEDVVYEHSVRIAPGASSDHSMVLATVQLAGVI